MFSSGTGTQQACCHLATADHFLFPCFLDKIDENLVNHAENLFILQDKTVGDVGYFCYPKSNVLCAECFELAEQDLKVKVSSLKICFWHYEEEDFFLSFSQSCVSQSQSETNWDSKEVSFEKHLLPKSSPSNSKSNF